MPPVSYATYDELKARVGEDQAKQVTPRPSDYDPETPDDSAAETYWESLLLEGSMEIDLHLSRAGYPAPCVTEVGGSTIVTDAADQLRSWCIALACGLSNLPSQGESDPFTKAAERARSQLRDLVAGKTRLNASLSASVAGAAVYPRNAPTANSQFPELGRAVFWNRNAPEGR